MVRASFMLLACMAVLFAAAVVPTEAHDSRKLLTDTRTPQQKATDGCNQALSTFNTIGNGNSNGGQANGGNGGGNGVGNGNGGLAGGNNGGSGGTANGGPSVVVAVPVSANVALCVIKNPQGQYVTEYRPY